MATITYFVPASYIKEHTVVDENVDEKYIKIAIQNAQNYKLKYLIGSGMYAEIKTQIDGNSLTAINTTLLNDYIVPYLVEQTLVELLPFTLDKISNRNVGTKDSEKTVSASSQRMEQIANEQETRAEMRANEMRLYILQNSASFPTYYNQGSGVDTIWPKTEVFSIGIYTGQSNRAVPRIEKLKYPAIYGANPDEY